MRDNLNQWAIRHGISYKAIDELLAMFGISPEAPCSASYRPGSEAWVQSKIRLEASRAGVKLWRNNVGALLDERGVPIRYGLANDSPALNKIIKSGDLIGWRRITITRAHVGLRIAQFVSRECKRPDWKYSGDEHEQAQLRWIEAIIADGGDACFVTGEGSL